MDATTRNLTAVALARAGFECESLREAEHRLGLQDLAGLIAGSRVLRDAWQRGRFLRQLGELAGSPVCEAAVAERLRFDVAGFRAMLAADPEALDIWEQGRHRFFLQARALVMKAAEQGKPHAVRTIERLLRAEAGGPAAPSRPDFRHLSQTELATATGIHRQQIVRWQGLPANEDGTYSLPTFIHWLRHSGAGRVRGYRPRPGAVEKRIIDKIKDVVHEELARAQSAGPGESNGDAR